MVVRTMGVLPWVTLVKAGIDYVTSGPSDAQITAAQQQAEAETRNRWLLAGAAILGAGVLAVVALRPEK